MNEEATAKERAGRYMASPDLNDLSIDMIDKDSDF